MKITKDTKSDNKDKAVYTDDIKLYKVKVLSVKMTTGYPEEIKKSEFIRANWFVDDEDKDTLIIKGSIAD